MNRILLLLMMTMLLGACNQSNTHLIRQQSKRKAVNSKYEERKKNLLHSRQTQLLDVLDEACVQEQEALKFLYAYMPLSDLSNYDGNYFLGQVRYALKARDAFAWGKSVNEDDFLHFVLPPRTGTENLDTARQYIFNELYPRIKGMTMTEAALEVNHWCHEKVVYTSTDDRTSAPLATIKTAFGRCGEESVFTVAALRAVGIPARQIYTPRWSHQDDNHAWVEFWADGKWYFYGACEPEAEVNVAWFTEPARRSMLTSTTTPGHYASKNIIEQKENYTTLNQVDNYTDAKDFYVKVVDTNGKPVQDATVRYLVYNYAEFYPLAVHQTDKNGLSSLRMGLGDVTVWSDNGDDFAFRKARVGETDTLVLALTTTEHTDYRVDMDIVPPVAKAPLPVSDDKRVLNNKRLALEDSIRHAYENTFMKSAEAVEFAEKYNVDSGRFADFIRKSRGNWADLCRVVDEAPDRDLAMTLFSVVTEKDLRDAPADILLSHLQHTHARPSDMESKLWNEYVLSPRIALERMSPFKDQLNNLLGTGLMAEFSQNPLAAEQWIIHNIRLVDERENYIWVPSVPSASVEMKAADAYSRNILFVAICRTAGVPARINAVTSKVQYWQGGEWKTVFDDSEKSMSNDVAASVAFDYKGREACKYSVHFSLARFEDGFFRTLTYEYGKDVKDFPKSIDLEPGYYMLVTGNRLNDGSVLSSLSFFDLKSGEKYVLPVELRQDNDALKVLGTISMPDFIERTDNSKLETGQLIKTYGAAAFVWLDPGKEPTRHVLKDLKDLKQTFDESNLPFLFFVPEEKQTASFHQDNYVVPQNSTFAHDTDMLSQLSSEFQQKLSSQLPVIVLVNAKGDVLYYSAGYKIGSCSQLLKSYQQVVQPDAMRGETCRIN